MHAISLALGGGGARGLSHLKVMEVLDAKEISVGHIAGTSIGALLGALYASGKSGGDIQKLLHDPMGAVRQKQRGTLRRIVNTLIWWTRVFRPDLKRTGLVRTEKFFDYIIEVIKAESFEDLKIPLSVIATDFHTGEEVVIDSGPLAPALMASVAIPGLFPPVKHMERVLIDGGVSNPVPFDRLKGDGPKVAIDVSPARHITTNGIPKAFDASQRVIDLLVDKLGDLKREQNPPDIYIRGDFTGIRLLDFDKTKEIYRQSQPMCEQLRKALREIGSEN